MSALCQKRSHAVQHKSAELGTAPGQGPQPLTHAIAILTRRRTLVRAPAETLAATEGSGAAIGQAPGMGRTGITSTASPGKIVKCGWFSKSFAAASFDSALTTVKAPRSLLMSSMP